LKYNNSKLAKAKKRSAFMNEDDPDKNVVSAKQLLMKIACFARKD